LKVPAEGFGELLDIIELAGYNEHTAKIVKSNLPPSYDTSKFPPKLLCAMKKCSD
jgi:hypothetical protein